MSDGTVQEKLTDFSNRASGAGGKKVSETGKSRQQEPGGRDELFEEYLKEAEHRYSHKNHLRPLKDYKEFLGGKRVADADLNDVRKFLWKQAERGIRRHTFRNYLSTLRELYRWIGTYYPESDPPNLEGISSNEFTRNVPETIEREPLTEEEVRKLINQPSNVRDRLLIAMFCYTGLRVGEMSGLRIEDVDLENQIVRVRAKSAKLGKSRKVPFPRRLVPLMKTWLERDRPSYSNSKNSPYFFVSKSGEKLSTHRMEKTVREYAEEAGIQKVLDVTSDGKRFHKVTPHALRHTFATRLLNKGMRVEHVGKLLGHKRLETTMRYAKVDENKAFESYRKMF